MYRSHIGFQNWAIAIFLMVTNLKGYSSTNLETGWKYIFMIRKILDRVGVSWDDIGTDQPYTSESELIGIRYSG